MCFLALAWAALPGSGAGCGSRKPAASDSGVACAVKHRFWFSPRTKLDLLFTIDDSPAMKAVHGKVVRQLPRLMQVLWFVREGLVDAHIGVVSSSMGAGRYTDVPGCGPGGAGDNDGRLMHPAACTALGAGQTFLAVNGQTVNFTGDIADAFACLGDIGTDGCGFPQPLAATRRALEKAQDPTDPDNGGFLRKDAYLAVVLITGQDDCSVPRDSDLFDPSQITLADRYGGLHAYRCSEFGHLCDGHPLPHAPAASGERETLLNCQAAEGQGLLTSIGAFRDFLFDLKEYRSRILLSAIAGPVTPYAVGLRATEISGGMTEQQPELAPSCIGADGDTATPAVRVKSWLDAFGENAILSSICADDFGSALTRIAEWRSGSSARCIHETVALTGSGSPDCRVTDQRLNADGIGTNQRDMPFCDAAVTTVPCWRLVPGLTQCAGGQGFEVCFDATCDITARPSEALDALITCAITDPC